VKFKEHARLALRIAAASLACGAIVAAASGPATAADAPGWKLVWSDEFDGPTIDPTKWDFDLGNGFFNYDSNTWISGWGNNELQYYTREPTNAFAADGVLHIRAVKESMHGCGYTSAKLRSKKRDGGELFAKRYGRFEFRAKLPTGKGVWPALWMLPQEEKYGGWAASGEIDVLEARGQEPRKILGTIHFGGRWPANAHASKEHLFAEGTTIAEFHTYAVEWDPGEIRWYVDDLEYGRQNSWWSSGKTVKNQGSKPENEGELNAWPAPFDRPFYLVMNLAVGGKFLGNPDAATHFPAEMLVDHVRVYDRTEGYEGIKPRGKEHLPFK
jgi:beta-glucanase (GH16 family)